MGGMRFHDALLAPIAQAFGKEDLTVARAGIREGTLPAKGEEL